MPDVEGQPGTTSFSLHSSWRSCGVSCFIALRNARALTLAFGLLVLCAARAGAQPATTAAQTADATPPVNWTFSAAVWFYAVPDDDYAQPTVTADRGTLHLETRYNYEGHETGSVWVGYNFEGGEALPWELTPIVGGIFGDTTGVAPGYKGSVSWRRLRFYSEGEYVLNTGESSDSFFFNWSELTVSLVSWLRAGLATQRTRVYRTDRDIQRGIVVGATYKNLDIAGYVLNPDVDRPTGILSIAVTW
jgi:hypothetical protein